MKVIATDKGFDNFAVREEGDIFDMPAGSKASWYRKPTKKELELAGLIDEAYADEDENAPREGPTVNVNDPKAADATDNDSAPSKRGGKAKDTAKPKATDPDPEVVASEEKVAKDWLPPDQQG